MKRLIMLFTLAVAAACGNKDKDVTGIDASVVGTYTLQSVNNDPIPSNFDDNGSIVVISAGTATLNADGTFTYSETWDGVADVTSGTYSKTGDTYTFVPTPTAGDPTPTNGIATISAGGTMTLTVTEPGQSPTVRVLQKN